LISLNIFPYIIFFLCNLLLFFPLNNGNKIIIYDKYKFIFFSIIIIYFIGFRGFIYSDWISYYNAYIDTPTLFDKSKINKYFDSYNWEKGFLIYQIIIKTFTNNYFLFQSISFIIDYLILYIFFKRYIPDYILLGFIFYIIFSGLGLSINLLRNSKSIMLFLLSIKYCYNKNILKYMIINIIGVFFHISSLLYIPLYFILNIRISKYLIFILYVIGNMIFLLQLNWMKNILFFIVSKINIQRLTLITNIYLNSKEYSAGFGITIGYLERQFTFLLVYIFVYKNIINQKRFNIFINLFYIYSFIYLYFSEITIVLQRLPALFICSYWILYPNIYKNISKNNKYLFLLFLIIYSFLRLNADSNNPLAYYDNFLTGYKTYEERVLIFNQFKNN